MKKTNFLAGFPGNFRALLTGLLLLISFGVSAQYDSTKLRQAQNSYGFDWRNGKFKNSLVIPTDTIKMAVADSGAIAFKNLVNYTWTGYYWITSSGATLKTNTGGYKLINNTLDSLKVLTATNGLTADSATNGKVGVKLGGTLTGNTKISNPSGYDFTIHVNQINSNSGFLDSSTNAFVGIDEEGTMLRNYDGNNQGLINVTGASPYMTSQKGIEFNHNSFIGLDYDAVYINPYLANLIIDSLNRVSGATKKMMVWDSTPGSNRGKVGYMDIPPTITNPVTGTGTLNFVPKWTPNGTSLGNSRFFDNGSKAGLNSSVWFKKMFIADSASTNITADSAYSFINGYVSDTAIINTSNYGTVASAYVVQGSSLYIKGQGSWGFGKVQRNPTSNTFGRVNIEANGSGFMGFNSGGNAYIPSNATGASITGALSRGTSMVASNVGASISGYTTSNGVHFNAKMIASGQASRAGGLSQDAANVSATGAAAFINTFASAPGTDTTRVSATANASFNIAGAEGGSQALNSSNGGVMYGYAEGNSKIIAGNGTGDHGVFVGGHSNGTNSLIHTQGDGSFAFGQAAAGDSLFNNKPASGVMGRNLYNTGYRSYLIGSNLRNTTDSTVKIGYANNNIAVSSSGTRFNGLIQRPLDTTDYKIAVLNSSNDLSKMYWPSGGSSLFPTTGIGTATGEVKGDLDGNTLNIRNGTTFFGFDGADQYVKIPTDNFSPIEITSFDYGTRFAGNVGIGTAPTSQFHVQGNADENNYFKIFDYPTNYSAFIFNSHDIGGDFFGSFQMSASAEDGGYFQSSNEANTQSSRFAVANGGNGAYMQDGATGNTIMVNGSGTQITGNLNISSLSGTGTRAVVADASGVLSAATNLTIPGSFNSSATQTTVSASTSGTVVFSQPFQGSSYKLVMIRCIGATGTATYNFPVAFSATPDAIVGGSATVSAISTTSVTITGAASTGFITISGF